MKQKQTEKNEKRTSIGGQALIEGIMMRGPQMTAMAVRNPEGEIVVEKWPTSAKKRSKFSRLPIVRGVYGFIESMVAGYKALMRSAEIAGLEDEISDAKAEAKQEKEAKKNKTESDTVAETEAVQTDALPTEVQNEEPAPTAEAEAETAEISEAATEEPQETVKTDTTPKKDKDKKESSGLMTVLMLVSTVLGVGLAVLLFIMLPSFIFNWCAKVMPFLTPESVALSSLIKSAFEGFLKIAILVAYMSLVTLMKDIRRTFQFHGAEHKTIFCYEHGKELTVENIRGERRFHPRCGTSFLILMLIVSIFVSFFIDPLFILTIGHVPHVLIRSILRLLLLPLVMGIGYELIKFAGRHDNLFTRIISAPGMWLQHITVLEPTDDMIECAIIAFKEVL